MRREGRNEKQDEEEGEEEECLILKGRVEVEEVCVRVCVQEEEGYCRAQFNFTEKNCEFDYISSRLLISFFQQASLKGRPLTLLCLVFKVPVKL